MSDVRSSLSICKRIKERLRNLDFVRKDSYEEVIETLMNFYEDNKTQFEKWKTKKK